jgi:hypothetical protein
LVKYAQDLGLDNVRAQLQELAMRYGERFTPARRLANCSSQ